MARFGIGFATAIAVATVACAGNARSAKAGSGPSAAATAPSTAASSQTANAANGAAPASGPTRTVVGRVEVLDRANDVTLSGTEEVGLGFDKFKIQPDTQVTVNGQRASAAEINPGDEVRASFTGKDSDAHLQRIDVLPANR